jgi:hypothetical protein
MSKQIKLGFDKTASQTFQSDEILVDVRGNQLRDTNGDFLYTETELTPTRFFSADNASSVYVNNEQSQTTALGKSISVREQFPEQSAVSLSLLGIPRAERQQTLLSDVSIYGLDDNVWEFSSESSTDPYGWGNRLNRTYGRRFSSRLKEYAEEQALALEMFPTSWSFPLGPSFQDRGFDQTLFTQYRRFIQLGNVLYDYYSTNGQQVFAQNHFLIPGTATLSSEDVIYNNDLSLAFEYIEQWTNTWMDIRDNRLNNPLDPGRKLNSAAINNLFADLGFTFSQTRPGYSSTRYFYNQLQSKESFRYQPGAISGFTFGVRLNSDAATLSNVLEWGCANETDQLMFQVKGTEFNIVRRSTVPLTERNLLLTGFTESDQKEGVLSPNPRETTAFFELVIPSDRFNGDPLDGTGNSGYNISFKQVTMYKIEYSWYGAIGARFYAYVPVSNDQARWVLIHTLVIENTLDKPSLQNPLMHFRYAMYINDTGSLREPIYLYKYGASYYIDGNDTGTFLYKSYQMPVEKSITSANSRPLIGFISKDSISNRIGDNISNQKNFYFESISATADKNTRIDVLECQGCPGGHGYFYATCLRNGQKGQTDVFRINSSSELVYVDPEKSFTTDDNNKKIIAPGVYSAYVFSKNGDNQAMKIQRSINGTLRDPGVNPNDKALVNGISTSLIGYEFTGRLTGYDDIAASTFPITKTNVRVQFLNPVFDDSNGQLAEFKIGITAKKPELVTVGEQELLLFGGSPLNMDEEISGEFSNFTVNQNITGAETGERDGRSGRPMQQDVRLPNPPGVRSGLCSELNFTISTIPIINVTYTQVDPSDQLQGDHFIVFQTAPPTVNLQGGAVGTFDGNIYINSGITFTSDVVSYEFEVEGQTVTNFVVAISNNISQVSDISQNGIAIRGIRCFGRHIDQFKITAFENNEYYLFVAMRDNAGINNMVVKESDDLNTFSHTPFWIVGDDSNIDIIQVENSAPGAAVFDKLSTSNEYIGTDGRFYMGGVTFTGNTPANFAASQKLESIQFDTQLSLPLRPATLKTSLFLTANKTETIDLKYFSETDRFKLTKGALNNRYLYLSSIVLDAEQTGTIQINISGKEQ